MRSSLSVSASIPEPFDLETIVPEGQPALRLISLYPKLSKSIWAVHMKSSELLVIICGIELIKLLFLSISRISFARNFSVWLGDINGIKYLSILPFPKNSSKALRNI